jgi:hypothetical protein
MQVVDTLRRLQANGSSRIADAVSDWSPWARRRRACRVRRALWVTGFLLGLLAIAGLVLAAARSPEAAPEDDED